MNILERLNQNTNKIHISLSVTLSMSKCFNENYELGNNNIKAKCTLSSNNDKKIPCSFEQDVDEKNYDLQSYVGSNGNDLFYIFQDKDNYQLSCSDDGSKRLKIIIGIASGVVILLIVIITLCCCCKKKKVETIDNTERNTRNSGHKVISFNNNNLSSFRGINNQRNNLFH